MTSVLRKKVNVPTWNTGIVNPSNPYLTFVSQYAAGTKSIDWKIKQMVLRTEDPEYIKSACETVASLSRYDLCTLYTYTTPAYYLVTGLLRHNSGSSAFDTRLVHDPKTEWIFGLNVLFSSIDKLGCSSFLHTNIDKKRVLAFREAMSLPQCDTEEACKRKWDLVDHLYAELRPNFTKGFLKLCHLKSIESNQGILFYHQAARLFSRSPSAFPKQVKKLKSFADYLKAIPVLTNRTWTKILKQYVRDIDSIIAQMPPTQRLISVFRGVPHDVVADRLLKDPSFVSTTLGKDIARGFVMNDPQKCCVYRFDIPVGSRVLPLIGISRYFGEQEILLPRGQHYGVSLV